MPDISFAFRPATQEEIRLTSAHLLEHSRQALSVNVEHEPFGLLAHDGDILTGSIIGKIFLNWLHIDLIWVAEGHRGQGLGTRLMDQAAARARKMGLSGIEVWTQSWQAPEFYRKIGYTEFAVLEDFTPGHKRHCFRYYVAPSAGQNESQPLPEIIREHVKAYFRRHGEELPSAGIYERLMPLFEKPLIEVALGATGGNQAKTARLLGINRNTLHKKMVALGIKL